MCNNNNNNLWAVTSFTKEEVIKKDDINNGFTIFIFTLSLLVILSIIIIFLILFNNINYESDTKRDDDYFQNEIIEEYKPHIDKFGYPLPDKYVESISSEQGLRNALSSEQAGSSTSGMWHNGIDFPCPEETSVYATKSGIVYTVYPSYKNGPQYKGHNVYGGLIIIKHTDSTITLYGHLLRTDVIEGEWVEQGQQIGLSGGKKNKRGSGTSTGPHLHYSIYLDLEKFLYEY